MDEFDAKHGTDTGGKLPLDRFQIPSPNANQGSAYQAVTPYRLVEAVSAIGIDPREYTFIDLGCGKGRALILAAELGFRSVVGVEFVPDLVAIARANVDRLELHQIVVLTGDAAEFVFPPGKIVLFLYNPFWKPVMERVVRNLERLDREDVWVIYATPFVRAYFDESPGFDLWGTLEDTEEGMVVYRSTAKG